MFTKSAWFAMLGACALAACGGGSSRDDASAGNETFHATGAPLQAFSYDTGLVPAASPARVQLKLSAKSALTVDAAFTRTAEGPKGIAGGGKLALDVHFAADGRLAIDVPGKKIDDALAGLKALDIPVAAETAFDPFLLDGHSADVKAPIPETKLPPIPLGSVPGTLTLAISKGSTLTSKFQGKCVSVKNGHATYTGTARTSGTLVIEGTIALALPPPLDKTIALPRIEVPIPDIAIALTSAEVALDGAHDRKLGTCDGGSGSSTDAGADAGRPTDAGDASEAEAPVVEAVEATFDGARQTFPSIDFAEIDPNGTAAIYTSHDANLGYPQLDLFFKPEVGTTECRTNTKANIIYASDKSTSFQALGTIAGTSCTIVVTQFGPVGGVIEGSFNATMKQTGGGKTIAAAGSFRVIRR